MKYDIGDIIKICNENPMNSVWQVIDMATGDVFPVTGFSGNLCDIAFACNYTPKEESKQTTSKEVKKRMSEYGVEQVVYCSIWGYIKNGKEYTWRDFHVRNLTYSNKVFTLFINSDTNLR